MDKWDKLFAIAVSVVLIVTISYVAVLSLDITVSCPIGLFNWNPPPKENTISILLSYPDTIDNTISVNSTSCSVVFTLRFNGSMSENIDVEVVNASALYLPNKNTKIAVTFPEAFSVDFRKIISSGASILGSSSFKIVTFHKDMIPNLTNTVVVSQIKPDSQSLFYFPVSGDYSPTIQIQPEGDEIVYTYEQIRVHVLSSAEVEAEKISKINLGLSYAFFAFTVLGGLLILFEIRRNKKDKDVQIQLCPTNIIISPDKTSIKPDSSIPNTITLSNVQPYSEEPSKPKDNISDDATSKKPDANKSSPK